MLRRFGLGVTAALVAWSIGSGSGGASVRDTPAPLRTLTTQFTFTASVPANPDGIGKLDVWVPLPSDSPWQTVRDVTVDSAAPYKITREPAFGNRMVYVHADKPQTPCVVTVHFVVTHKAVAMSEEKDKSDRLPPDVFGDTRRLLAPDKNVPIGARYGRIADSVAGENTASWETMRAIFEHTVANMRYDYKKESPRYAQGDAAFVCDYKKGNCSDLHSYMISLARSRHIPAVLEFGFPLTGIPLSDPLPQEGSISGYHCWLWFQTPQQGWVPLDASDARRWLDAGRPDVKASLFGGLVLERSAVAVSRGRDLTLVPAQKAAPLNYFIYPYAEANGKPIEAQWKVSYRLVKP